MRLLVIAAVLLGLVSTGASRAQDDAPTWLFVVDGSVAAVSPTSLTLQTGETGLAFTDRPARTVRLIDLAAWTAGAWGAAGSFAAEPPNASLIDETDTAIAVVEITAAAWSDGVLSLTVRVLDGTMPAIGNDVALTIDALNTAVNNQITDA